MVGAPAPGGCGTDARGGASLRRLPPPPRDGGDGCPATAVAAVPATGYKTFRHGMLFGPSSHTLGSAMFDMDDIRGESLLVAHGSRQPSEAQLALAEHPGKVLHGCRR